MLTVLMATCNATKAQRRKGFTKIGFNEMEIVIFAGKFMFYPVSFLTHNADYIWLTWGMEPYWTKPQNQTI